MHSNIAERFDRMGARVKFAILTAPRNFDPRNSVPIQVDVRNDKKGEFFLIESKPELVNLTVADIDSKIRHLLLVAKNETSNRVSPLKFLCGHDERQWFASQMNGNSIANIRAAMASMQPNIVQDAIRKTGLKEKDRFSRRNNAFKRQGEWFFLPEPGIEPRKLDILRTKEPIFLSGRGRGGKPHIAEFAFRRGGQEVWISDQFPRGLTSNEYAIWRHNNPGSRVAWRRATRDMTLYVRGHVRHPDHKTIFLQDWCRVVLNNETRGRNVVFLD